MATPPSGRPGECGWSRKAPGVPVSWSLGPLFSNWWCFLKEHWILAPLVPGGLWRAPRVAAICIELQCLLPSCGVSGLLPAQHRGGSVDKWLGQAVLSVASGVVLHFLELKFHHMRHEVTSPLPVCDEHGIKMQAGGPAQRCWHGRCSANIF